MTQEYGIKDTVLNKHAFFYAAVRRHVLTCQGNGFVSGHARCSGVRPRLSFVSPLRWRLRYGGARCGAFSAKCVFAMSKHAVVSNHLRVPPRKAAGARADGYILPAIIQ
ncbi:hypothetical protein PJ610_000422 [Salmonella enterica]|nr:hypothetical protein [Salmonella enterica]